MRVVIVALPLALLLAGSLHAADPAAPAVAVTPAPAVAPAAAPAAPAAAADPGVLLGEISREQIEAASPLFVTAESQAVLDRDATRELLMIPPGAAVVVYLGTWCSDSRREVGRFWHALDAVVENVPFTIDYVGVDRSKHEPVELVGGIGLSHVPTFIVVRDGVEVGRIVEQAPHGIERDLVDLLVGKEHGFLSATQHPEPPPSPTPAPPPGSTGR